MEPVNYKFCKRCNTKVSSNSTRCLVCNNQSFATQEEIDREAKENNEKLNRAINAELKKGHAFQRSCCLALLVLAIIVIILGTVLVKSFLEINWPTVPGRVL
jgi:hypothetical protein